MAIKVWTTREDGLDNLKFTTAEKPVPKEGEVLVKINAVSLNYRDTEGTNFLSFLNAHRALLTETHSVHGTIQPVRELRGQFLFQWRDVRDLKTDGTNPQLHPR